MSHEQIDFNPELHTYSVNGRTFPGVTTILKNAGLTPDFSMIPKETLEYKRILGTEVHRVIELDLNDDLGDYDPVLESYVTAFRTFRDDFKIKPIETETAIYSAKYGYCGKLDLLAEYNLTHEGLFDFKNSLTVDLQHVGPQTGAYDSGYREWKRLTRKKPFERFAVQLLKTGKYKLIPCNNPNDFNVFFYALQLNNWKEQFKNGK